MKQLLKNISGIVAVILFSHCGSSQIFEAEAPVEMDTAYVEPWTAGEEKQYKGVNLLFPVRMDGKTVLDTVYYRYKKAPLLRIQKDNYLVYKATLELDTAPYDMVMHTDPREEAGNRPPPRKQHDFDLKDDEAIISYTRKGKIRYFKVSGLQSSPAIHYRERPGVKNRP